MALLARARAGHLRSSGTTMNGRPGEGSGPMQAVRMRGGGWLVLACPQRSDSGLAVTSLSLDMGIVTDITLAVVAHQVVLRVAMKEVGVVVAEVEPLEACEVVGRSSKGGFCMQLPQRDVWMIDAQTGLECFSNGVKKHMIRVSGPAPPPRRRI